MPKKNNEPDNGMLEVFLTGTVFGVGVLAGAIVVMLVLTALLGAAGAATSAYDDACQTEEIVVEYENGEPMVYVEDRDPAWFCVTKSNDGVTVST